MKIDRRHSFKVLSLALGGLVFASALQAQAQTYPTKPIRIVVPFAAGGPADQLARVLAIRMAPLLGQQMVVDNKAGAATIIGWDTVAKSQADGYTLLLAGVGGRTILPQVANLPYDPVKDLVPVTRVANSPNIFVVSASHRERTLADFVKRAKAEPGKLNLGLAAPGTLTHFAGTLLQQNAGISLTEVSYKGGAPTVNALLSGEIDFMTADIGAVMSQLQAGKLVALAVADNKRLPALPNVPTAIEAGVPGIVAVNVWGLYAPAGTPKAVIGKIADAAAVVLKQPDVQEILSKQGLFAESSTPEAFEALNREQSTRWGSIAKASGLRIN